MCAGWDLVLKERPLTNTLKILMLLYVLLLKLNFHARTLWSIFCGMDRILNGLV